MEISEWTWKSFDGLDMYARGWAPPGKPKAAIMLVHGRACGALRPRCGFPDGKRICHAWF